MLLVLLWLFVLVVVCLGSIVRSVYLDCIVYSVLVVLHFVCLVHVLFPVCLGFDVGSAVLGCYIYCLDSCVCYLSLGCHVCFTVSWL